MEFSWDKEQKLKKLKKKREKERNLRRKKEKQDLKNKCWKKLFQIWTKQKKIYFTGPNAGEFLVMKIGRAHV